MPARAGAELPFGTWHSERSATADAVTIQGEIHLPAGTHAAERFAEFRTSNLKALEALRVPFELGNQALRKSA